ncbi:MAG: D-tyrosyl-tRNA(Tyr) deacylase [Deltaproteobacteria bacterium]|nr:D-tyrosyl-tRNA(Tyr) deacylase [Deltaproteobacteria bacterium]
MRAVIQRVSSGRVEVDGQVTGAIEHGLLVYLGVGAGDDATDVAWMADKIATLRIFPDDAGKMSRSVEDTGGGVLVVSQFTLFGDVRKGRRPSFDGAAPPEIAERLYESVCESLRARGLHVGTGRFRAMMDVVSVGDGPVTILADSRKGL